jgi:hypothetical protein
MSEDTHEAFTAALRRRAAEIAELLPAGGSGRGIVICAGGARIFTNAYVLLHVLRRTLGCRLPIEIWHFGSAELPASMAAALDPFEVELVDAQAYIDRTRLQIHDGWQLKSLAVAASAFGEVLLLDADQVPVADPAAVFDWPEYAGTGAVFWPDIMDLSASNEIWRVLGLEPATTTSLESGQLLVDRRRHQGTLALAVALNEQAEKLYRLIYGDKDTFLMAWKLTGAAFVIVPHQPYVDERCLVQRDFAGAPLFQHRTNSKWIYAGEQFRIPGAVFEAECLAALDELRKKWNGHVFAPPARSVEARAIESGLAAAGLAILET